MLDTVRRYGYGICSAGPVCRCNRSIVWAAVCQDGEALEVVDHFSNDKAIVLAAVQQNGYASMYADRSLLADKDVLNAIKIHNISFINKYLYADVIVFV